MEAIINSYYEDNAKKLRNMVDKILFKLKYVDVDNEDFYSLANEVFAKALKDYDKEQSFNGFIYSCLYKKFCTEMTRQNRYKRQADKLSISMYLPLNDEENGTIGDTVADRNTIESNFFGEKEEGYSKEMSKYLSRLSKLQREVLRLMGIGFMPSEIIEELHINQKMYEDCYAAIRSDRNKKILL